eukprot:2834886-Prymnesium_polylepis.2
MYRARLSGASRSRGAERSAILGAFGDIKVVFLSLSLEYWLQLHLVAPVPPDLAAVRLRSAHSSH